MKKLALLSIALCLFGTGNAQDNYSSHSATAKHLIWSVGINPSIPVGHFNDYSSFGLGANAQGEYKPGRAGITVNFGYIDYFGKTKNGVSYSDFKYWPLMGGLKYYLGTSYLHGQLGAGFGSKGLGTSFWYGAGYGFNFGKTVDLELQYMGWKQDLISGSTGTTGYGGGTGGTGGTGGGGGYGGHYPTFGLRLGFNF
ncbi:MAG TPA: hypothetical protein VNR87_04315 [Flavisolibacter sp.]|nr:hypothetical protein [Flavisolibacter sp.]